MRRLRWAALPVCAGLLFGLWSASARAETFVFRDGERGEVSGKVLVEFPELLFVSLDGEGPTFLRRAELSAIVDEAGKRHEQAPLGTFAAVGKTSPAAAITDVTGRAWRTVAQQTGAEQEPAGEDEKKSAAPEAPDDEGARPGELRMRDQEGAAEFVHQGSGLRTGEDGVVHGLFPSGTHFWVGVESEVGFGGPTEQIGLVTGELTLETRLIPLQVLTERALDLRLAEASQVVVQREGRVIRLAQHRGRTRIAWPEFSFALHEGQSVDLSDLGKGRWTVAADGTNDEPLHLMVKGKPETLGPGQERELGTEALAEASLWRHLASRGELLLRRGPQGSFRPVAASDRSLLSIGPGDALQTGPAGEAALVRQDGARLTLKAGSWIELDGEELQGPRGDFLIEALGAPVIFGAPGGTARLTQAVVFLRREGAGGLDAPLEVHAVAGRPVLPLGYAEVALEPRTKARLRLTETPPDPPEELERFEGRERPADDTAELQPRDRRVVRGEARPEKSPEDESPPGRAPVSGERGPGGEAAPRGEAPSPDEETRPKPAPAGPAGSVLLPASSGEKLLPSFEVEILAGAGLVRSGQVEQLGNPKYRAKLDTGDVVAVRPPSTLQRLGGLALPGQRDLRMRGTELEVMVSVDPVPELRFEGFAPVQLKEGLVLALDRVRNLPALEFRSGERLLLQDYELPFLVENPTIRISGLEAVIEVAGELEAAIKKAGKFGAMAFVTREDDHLEVLKAKRNKVQMRRANVELVLEDGRELRIQPKAPPVDARVADAKGTLFLSMKGAPSFGLDPSKALTVLATNEGEFVILDNDAASADRIERQGLAFSSEGDTLPANSERLIDLLDIPIPDSPSGF